MAALPKQYVKDLRDKQPVHSVFLASDKMVMTDKNGKPYMSVNLVDVTGSINARIWDKVTESDQAFEPGDFLVIKGHVQVYQNRRQVVIHDLNRAEDS